MAARPHALSTSAEGVPRLVSVAGEVDERNDKIPPATNLRSIVYRIKGEIFYFGKRTAYNTEYQIITFFALADLPRHAEKRGCPLHGGG